MALGLESFLEFFAEDEGKKAAEDMTADRFVSAVIDRSSFEHTLYVAKDLLHLPVRKWGRWFWGIFSSDIPANFRNFLGSCQPVYT
jgi:hypothetical protein